MLSGSDLSEPPDEWIALSPSERAELLRKVRVGDSDQRQQLAPNSACFDAAAPNCCDRTLLEVAETSLSLEPNDRMRLIAHLGKTLPPENRAAIIGFGLENLQFPDDEQPSSAVQRPANTLWSDVSRFLFDPANTSELYSAPRRFDLATIFVATAAYSLLFGMMNVLSYKYLGPVTEIAVGVFVTIIAAVQTFYKGVANPRGVSVLAGAVSQTVILTVIRIANPQIFPEPMALVVLFYGLMGGALAGYLAGVLVGGVFLVADRIRQRFAKPSEVPDDEPPTVSD